MGERALRYRSSVRLALATVGTRSDLQPYVVMAKGSRVLGHRLAPAAHEDHRSLVFGDQTFRALSRSRA